MNRARFLSFLPLLTAFLLSLGLLARSADAAKGCYDCHKDKKAQFTSLKHVHSPVKDQNCEGCHKRHGFSNTLVLIKDNSELCFTCHADLKEKYATGTVHFPVKDGKCWDCHDPHGSDKPMFLRKGPEGLDDPSSCLICHKRDLEKAMAGSVPHKPFNDLNCTTCHTAHNSEHMALLKNEPTALCTSCHDSRDKQVTAAHDGKHAENLACTDCHSGHAGSAKGLLAETSHPPFGAGECESCHSLPDAAGAVAFAEGVTPGNLCANCHAVDDMGLSKKFPHSAVAADNCADCHSAHSSRYPHLLKQPEAQICAQCHADVISPTGLTPHLPVVNGQCGSCHEVHGSDHEHLVKSTDAKLCLDCHQDFQHAQDSAKTVHAAVDDCLTCHHPHQGQTKGILRKAPGDLCGDCHEVDNDALSAQSGHPPYLNRNCASCHLPHYSNTEHLTRAEGTQLCASCHSSIMDRTKMRVTHPPAAEDCATCHTAHYSRRDNLLTDAEGLLCSGCHDDASINRDKQHVHSPVADGDCSGCHNPHGANRDKLITGRMQRVMVNGIAISRVPVIEKDADLCYSCHEGLTQAYKKEGVHQPVAEGKCRTCHSAHGSNHAGFTSDEPAKMCGQCHTLDTTLMARHDNYSLASADCLDCHNPHSSEKPKLARKFSHPPFEERSCDNCHSQNTDGSVQLAGSVSEICGTCHDTAVDGMKKKHLHVPFAGGDCTSCHSAHTSDWAKLLKQDGNQLCKTCHDDLRSLAHEPEQHKPFADGKCLTCHTAHSSNEDKLLTKSMESMCLGCHSELKDQMDKGLVHAPVRNGDCGSCHVPHAGQHKNLLVSEMKTLCTSCHDMNSAQAQAAHRGFPMADANCQSCHDPHVGKKGGSALMLPNTHKPFTASCNACHQPDGTRAVKGPVKELCLGCHEKSRADMQHQFAHAPVNEENGCVNCHGPHVGFGKGLQTKEGVQLCLDCHDGPEFQGEIRHSVAFQDCNACHRPHSANSRALLDDSNIMSLCMGCHPKAPETHYHPMGDKAIDPRTNQPVNCIGCHSPHSSGFSRLLIADKNRKLCTLCHDVSHSGS